MTDDISRRYLDEIGRLPRLTPEAERELGRRLSRLRRGQCRRLFACPYVVRLVLETLRGIERGELELSRAFDFPQTRGTAARLRGRLPKLMRSLRGCVTRNGRDFRTVVCRSAALPVRRRANRRLIRRGRAASRLLSALPWRFVHLQQMMRAYARTVSRLERLRAEVRQQTGSQSDAACGKRTGSRYRAALARAQEGVRAMRRRLSHVQRIDTERERVRWSLIEANLRLVVAIAKTYRRSGVPLLDLIQDGNAGILRAADKFDPRKGTSFGAYAGWWIRSSIRRNLSFQVSAVRLPADGWATLCWLRQVAGQLWHEDGQSPRLEELAAAAGVSEKDARRLMTLDGPLFSLDAVYNDEETGVGEQLPDRGTDDASQLADRRHLVNRMDGVLGTLTSQERRIIELRFGLADGEGKTLADVGRIFNVSGEWIRRQEAAALEKLRQPHCRQRLEDFLAD